jgi:hypothetical protein
MIIDYSRDQITLKSKTNPVNTKHFICGQLVTVLKVKPIEKNNYRILEATR